MRSLAFLTACVLLASVAVAVAVRPSGPWPVLFGDDEERRVEAALARSSGEIPALEADLETFSDPVLREAVVLGWIARHRAEVDTPAAVALCERLYGVARDACARRVSSPHLLDPEFQ